MHLSVSTQYYSIMHCARFVFWLAKDLGQITGLGEIPKCKWNFNEKWELAFIFTAVYWKNKDEEEIL